MGWALARSTRTLNLSKVVYKETLFSRNIKRQFSDFAIYLLCHLAYASLYRYLYIPPPAT
jgi:hypothetical protein